MDKYYKKLSTFLINNKIITKDDRELYEYAEIVLFHALINIVATVLIGTLLGMLKECLCMFSAFFILRKFTGGLHTKKYIYCFLYSISLIGLSLCIIRYFASSSNSNLFISLGIISTVLIWIFAPVENQNKQLSIKEKKYINIFLYFFLYYFCCLHDF